MTPDPRTIEWVASKQAKRADMKRAAEYALQLARTERMRDEFDPGMKIDDRPCLWFAAVMLVFIAAGQIINKF